MSESCLTEISSGEETDFSIKKKKSNKINSNEKILNSIIKILNQLLEENKKLPNYKNILKHQSKSSFSLKKIPKIDIESFLKRINKYCEPERSTLILSLIYIDKLCINGDIVISEYNIHRILLTSIFISLKYNEDILFSTKYYSKIFGINIKELTLLETTFLEAINFNAFVSNDVYEQYSNYLKKQ
jgi:hypothetical protein